MCENYDWAAVDPANWREVPFIEKRIATEDDVRCGRAVFYVEGSGSQVVTGIKLPALAELTDEDGTTEVVIVIQAEALSGEENKFAVGFRNFDGGNGVGMRHQFKLIDPSKP